MRALGDIFLLPFRLAFYILAHPRYMLGTLGMALRALTRNVMRSALTTLGIIIGVGAVIAMVEIGQGASREMQATISRMGASMLMVMPGAAASGGASFGGGSALTLTPDDARALADPDRCPAIVSVAPVVRGGNQQVVNPANGKNWIPNQFSGTSPEYLDVRKWTDLTDGDPFTYQDVSGQREVCLLGQTVARELFPNESPVGKQVRISNKPFTVVGVLGPKGATMFGQDQDDVVLAPWTTIKFKVSGQSTAATATTAAASSTDPTQQMTALKAPYPNKDQSFLYSTPSSTQAADQPDPVKITNINQIMVEVRSADEIKQAMDQIKEVLRERHHIKPGQTDDFNVRDMTEMNNAMSQQGSTMGVLLLVVALISLVVGGVGIMNIMLVSVTERTREIGLRMAVGARSYDIMTQFLVESAVLCLLGGVIGIVLGMGASWLVTYFKGWPTEPSVAATVGAVGVSAAVGLVFGFYPAYKASKLDPIEALRYE
jgi:ABC-type antimicrobial peptide transport system permease subunit